MTRPKTKIAPGGFIELEQGAFVSRGGRSCRIRRALSIESVIIQYLDTEETERVHPTELRPITDAVAPPTTEPAQGDAAPAADAKAPATYGRRDLYEIMEEDWAEARRRLEIITPLMEKADRKRVDVEATAKKYSVNAATIYDWIRRYRRSGHLSGLIPSARGRQRGDKYLTPEQEGVIAEVIETDFLDPQSTTPSDIVQKVLIKCKLAGVEPPSPNTVRNRIADIPLKRRLAERGNKDKARQLTEARPGDFPDGNYPLETVQLDHVRVDMKVVDAETRETIETRPWLTLAIDCHTRMIVGYFLSLFSPSAFSAGVCIFMGMMPKRDLLAMLDLPGSWPVYGKFRRIHMDNASEFKGEMLKLSAAEHNIDIQLRAMKKPYYGAYIERMVGNVNGELHKRLGTTHRSPKESPDYDSSAKAVYTLAELEKEIVDWIVNCYHKRMHSGLGTTPLAKWEQGLLGDKKRPGVGLPPVPADPQKLRMDLMPLVERSIHPYGVEIEKRCYYHEVLNRWINAADPGDTAEKRKFIFRYDLRTIRMIWFWDPEARQYFEIPVHNTAWPDISWSEFRTRHRAMVKEGMRHVDEAAILGYTVRSKAREAEAFAKTRAARGAKAKSAPKGAARSPANQAMGSAHYAKPSVSSVGAPPAETARPDDTVGDIFDAPVKAFDDLDI